MTKYSAEALSLAGDQFLGRSYTEMDCQAFVEACLASVGCRKDLKGANAWWREMTWTGTPEECVKIFGSVPNGAFLFIHAYDGGEEARGYFDGLGNASHIGIKTGRGKGAIHSSSTRQCVAESEFHDKTIRGGGWNKVGLWIRMDYGKSINWLLEHSAPAENGKEEGKSNMRAIVAGPNGETVNLREKASKDSGRIMKVPDGTPAEVLETKGAWSRVEVMGQTGWMMSEYLKTDEAGEVYDGTNDDAKITLTFTAGEISAALPFLDKLVEAAAAKVGRG